MSVTDGIGQTPCSLEHYLVIIIITNIQFVCKILYNILSCLKIISKKTLRILPALEPEQSTTEYPPPLPLALQKTDTSTLWMPPLAS